MVFNTFWMNNWVIPGISAGVLICAVAILMMCTCIRSKNKNFCALKFFNNHSDPKPFPSNGEDTNGEYGFFRKFSVLSANKLKVSTGKLKAYKNSNYMNFKEDSLSRNELLDSFDDSNSFEDALLQINNTDMDNFHIDMSEESDETLSCLSNDSKFTAYSTITLTRGSSFAETIKSALSYTDINKS